MMGASDWLRPHFEREGEALRFDRFMELALFDSQHGYYAQLDRIGSTGDFSTSASLSSLLAVGIASWFKEQPERHLIELGPGTGELSWKVRRDLARFPIGLLRPRFHLHLVERSSTLRRCQEERLSGCRRVHWHNSLPDALEACGGEACLFSNEFVDAWPVRVFQKAEGGEDWRELYLGWSKGALAEEWWPVSDLPDSSVFEHPWKSGQRIEVHDSYRAWLTGWCPVWRSGQLLTVDYGGSPPQTYHRRPGGSLRAYHHHQRLTGAELYRFPGQRDLTADVNMDDLHRWGEQDGLTTLGVQSQRDFLLPHLPAKPSDADQFLVHPDGAGTAFQVLLQECPSR